MIIFPLEVHKTYYEQGFFNVKVEFDRAVRRSEGAVWIEAGPNRNRIEGRIDRSANNSKTARVMGGTELRDWFKSSCSVGGTVFVDLTDLAVIRITSHDPRDL